MKKLITLAVLSLAIFALFAGCTPKKDDPAAQPPSVEDPNTPPTDDTETPPADTEKSKLSQLISVIGMTDEEAVALMGEGTPVKSEETIIAREYTDKFFDKTITYSVAVNDSSVWALVSIPLEDNDVEAWLEKIKGELGDFTNESKDNGDEGNGRHEYIWEMDKTTLSLKTVYDALSIEIFANIK